MAQFHSWPGERQPSDRDVELGIESLDSVFLNQFKEALKASAASSDDEPLMQMRLHALEPPAPDFTYPLSILYEFPRLPAHDVVDMLYRSFAGEFQYHPLLNTLPAHVSSRDNVIPFFRYSLACFVAAVTSQRGRHDTGQTARDLYFAGSSLWNVMLEVDNREARTLEGVLSPTVLALYGVLTVDLEVWNLVEQQLLSSACTMARRLRLHDPFSSEEISTPLSMNATAKSDVVSLLFLTCTLAAVHMNIPLYMTSAELSTLTDPNGKTLSFHDLYTSLLRGEHAYDSLRQMNNNPLLLLVAILSDIICMQRALIPACMRTQQLVPDTRPSYDGKIRLQDPPPVLSPESEGQRMSEQLTDSLHKWYQNFSATGGHSYLALFYFCRLYVECPGLSYLLDLVEYPPKRRQNSQLCIASLHELPISDKAVDFSWMILDHVGSKVGGEEPAAFIWDPLIVFLAALVVWAKTQQHVRYDTGSTGGRRKQLLPFKLELERMAWPCCTNMVTTIDRLIYTS